MQNKRLILILAAASSLLLIPLIAMQFTKEVNWNFSDFLVGGFLLFGTGLICELVIKKVRSLKYRVAVCGTILATLVLVWIQLAVGIF